jgi:hypothetical protein
MTTVKQGLWINRPQRPAGQPIKRGRIKRLEKHFQRSIQDGKNYAKVKEVPPQSSSI